MAHEFKAMKGCLKEWKEIMKWGVIEGNAEIKAQLPSPLFEEKVAKRVKIDVEDNDIEVEFRNVGAFLVVDDVKFSKQKVERLGFEAYVTVFRMNDGKVMFLAMVNNNLTNGKIHGIFSNRVGRKVKKKKKKIKMGVFEKKKTLQSFSGWCSKKAKLGLNKDQIIIIAIIMILLLLYH